jgi:hypothetical protein
VRQQLHVDAHGVAALLHAPFQDVGDAKLPRDLGQVSGTLFELINSFAASKACDAPHFASAKCENYPVRNRNLKRQTNNNVL